ncbi:MAG TPA: 2-dehydro-3-deoxygalactonokinase [Hyphomicrobiaceae bacterium]|nr:2-dehydro-3-deoxygalactonokinase [Hyphomicrobiaceae bacterium]
MTNLDLISVDWGTTSFRAALVGSDGRIVDRRAGAEGILAVPDGDFRSVLERYVVDWRVARPTAQIVMSGMIGSRQGWVEAPYAATPASLDVVARDMRSIDAGPVLGAVLVVPGVAMSSNGLAPDVMRGEETQVFGALGDGERDRRLFVLPGTHSKWVDVRDGAIAEFATYMSGEIFAALTSHTILGRLMADAKDDDRSGYADGVRAGAADGHAGDLLNRVFWARTHGLVDGWPGGRLKSFLSGLLIGAELKAASRRADGATTFTIIGSDTLSTLYLEAARVLGMEAVVAEPDRAVAGQILLLRARKRLEHGA